MQRESDVHYPSEPLPVSPHSVNPRLRFLRSIGDGNVSYDQLLAFDREMARAAIEPFSNPQGKTETLLAKVASRLHLMWNLHRSSKGPIFVSFMGYSEYRIMPFSYGTEIIPYCFDCWPELYERWLSFFKRHRVRFAFFSARQSALHFAKALPSMKSVWLPEACDPFDYRPSKPWLERSIDVLEFGRKNEIYHARIMEPLARANKVHLYVRIKGQTTFSDSSREAFLEGLGESKISICFPSSQTHPERAGSIETVTHRYFQSMASKCLLLGHAPQELVDLFGYNPVIEVQQGDEFAQIESLLNTPNSHRDSIEKNYKRLLEVGTEKYRIDTLLRVLRDVAMLSCS